MSAEEIARGLTKAQRAICLGSEPGGFGDPETACGHEVRGRGQYAAAQALERKGLGEVEEWGALSTLYFNNALGLEVRAIIERDRP